MATRRFRDPKIAALYENVMSQLTIQPDASHRHWMAGGCTFYTDYKRGYLYPERRELTPPQTSLCYAWWAAGVDHRRRTRRRTV